MLQFSVRVDGKGGGTQTHSVQQRKPTTNVHAAMRCRKDFSHPDSDDESAVYLVRVSSAAVMHVENRGELGLFEYLRIIAAFNTLGFTLLV